MNVQNITIRRIGVGQMVIAQTGFEWKVGVRSDGYFVVYTDN